MSTPETPQGDAPGVGPAGSATAVTASDTPTAATATDSSAGNRAAAGATPPAAAAAPAEKPALNVELEWRGDLRFQGETEGRPSLKLDSEGKDGVSPMQALAFAVAGCMGMDVVHILTKARNAPRAVRASFTGRRPLDSPSRFTAIALHFVIDGDAPDEQVERALNLSRDKYCSVWNSMRQDIDFNVTFTVNRSTPAAQPPPTD